MSQNLELVAMRWLAFEKRCHAVLFERSPDRRFFYRPDVIGLNKSRYLLEVEIKRSVQDFKANAGKTHVQNRDMYLDRWPKQFWFFVPSDISEKVLPLVPEWAGLAHLVDDYQFSVLKPAPTNKESRRMSVKQCAEMFHLLSNQLISSEGAWRGDRNNRVHEPCYWFDGKPYGSEYQI